LNIPNAENQYWKHDEYFNDIINEEMDATADRACRIQIETVADQHRDQIGKPLHPQDLIVQPDKDRTHFSTSNTPWTSPANLLRNPHAPFAPERVSQGPVAFQKGGGPDTHNLNRKIALFEGIELRVCWRIVGLRKFTYRRIGNRIDRLRALGSRLIDLQPEQDGCCEDDCRQEYLWASIVSGGDSSPVFQAAEHYLDPVASFVATLVIFDGLGARLSFRDAGRYSLIYKGLPEPIRVISSVSQ
jgi:hypothetical protein